MLELLKQSFSFVWVGMGIVGVIWMAYKGYFSWVSNLGCTAWILGGWIGLCIALLIVFLGGGILLLIAWRLPGRPPCPYCKQRVSSKAIKCPHCQSDLTVAP